jgi:hypothetical protein
VPVAKKTTGGWSVLAEGAHLMLLGFAVAADSRWVWTFVVATSGWLAFSAWIAAKRRSDAMAITPRSRIASAAQGYVELAGIAEVVGEGSGIDPGSTPLRDPVTGTECVWFRVESFHRDGHGENASWEPAGRAHSKRPIGLRDDSGLCLLHHEGAEISVGAPQNVMTDADTQHWIWRIRAGEPLYAIGMFRTVVLPAPGHAMWAPDDGRPYLIANKPQAAAMRRFRWRQWFHLGLFAVGVTLAALT